MGKKHKKRDRARYSLKSGICFEALEPRLLLSGTWGAVVDGTDPNSQSNTCGGFIQETVLPSENTGGSEKVTLTQTQNAPAAGAIVDILAQTSPLTAFDAADSVPEAPSTSDQVVSPTGISQTNGTELNFEPRPDLIDATQLREVVFVNENVANYEQLIADLQGGDGNRAFEVVILDADRDGIEQISNILVDRSDLTAVHFITDATNQAVKLGASWLSLGNISFYSADIASWRDALANDADLLFYGCNFADGEAGQTLINAIGELTGADVAASVDNTGHHLLGGDWELEYDTGDIETQLAFTANIQNNWFGVLGVAPVLDLDADDSSGQSGADYAITFTENGGAVGIVDADAALSDSDTETVLATVTFASETASGWQEQSLSTPLAIPANTVFTVTVNTGNTYYVVDDYGLSSPVINGPLSTVGTAGVYGPVGSYPTNTWLNSNYFRDVVFNGGSIFTAQTPPDLHLTDAVNLDLSVRFRSSVAGEITAIRFWKDSFETGTHTGRIWVEGAYLNSLTVSITNLLDGAAESLSADTTGTSITASYNSGTGVLTLSGADTVANYQQVLRTVSYNNTSENPDTTARSITFVANDGTNDSNVGITTVTMIATNDVPVAVADSFTVVEGSTTNLDLAANDSDADDGLDLTSITIVSGPTNGAIVVNANGTVDYTHDGSETVADSFTYTIADLAGVTSNTVTLNLTVNPVNDAPVVTLPGAPVTYYAGGSALVVDASATVSDVDSTNFNSGDLRVGFSSGGTANDVLSIRNQGTGTGEIGVSGSTVSYEGVDIGTFSVGTGPIRLDIDLNASATPEAVQALARNITYENISATPTTTPRQVGFALRDGDGGQNGIVSPDRQCGHQYGAGPGQQWSPDALHITEDDATNNGNLISEILASDGALPNPVTDADTAALEGIAINSLDSSNGTWEYNIGGGWNAVGTVTWNSSLLLRDTDRLRFVPDGLNADFATVTFTAWDQTSGTAGIKVDTFTYDPIGAFSFNVDVASINVTAVNDAPTGQDKTIITPEDTTYTFTLSDFGYNDVDGDSIAVVKILPLYADLVELDGVGLSAARHDISITDINNGKLTFEPPANLAGTGDLLRFVVNDGIEDSAFKTIAANVTAVDDVPQVAVSLTPLSYTEQAAAVVVDGVLTLTDIDGGDITSGTVSIAEGFVSGDSLNFRISWASPAATIRVPES